MDTAQAPSTGAVDQQATSQVHSSNVDWTTGLNEDTRGFVQNRGFKDPGMVLDSYRNMETSFLSIFVKHLYGF